MIALEVASILEETGWTAANRDDRAVAKLIAEGDAVDAVYSLEEGAALDELLEYLKQTGMMSYFEALASRLPVVRQNVPSLQYVLLYFVKTVMGVSGMAEMSPLLLRDPALMQLLGFNAHQIENGVTRRGDAMRAPGTEREGPVSTEAIADNIVKLHAVALEDFFNHIIQAVVPRVILTSLVTAILDTSEYETTEKFQGVGKVLKEKVVPVKGNRKHTKKVEVMVWGWKVGVLYHSSTGLPLAVKLTTIEKSDHTFVQDLVDTAIKNLGSKKLNLISLDRGFVDGETLWQLKHVRGIDFIIPAKTNMLIYADACKTVERWHAANKPKQSGLHPAEREELRSIKKDGKASSKLEKTCVVGVEGLTTLDSYGPPGHKLGANRKDFQPNPLNAVVVWHWRGEGQTEPAVFLTSLAVQKPFYTYDRYDERSTIENGVFREGKQHWMLQQPPKKSEAGVTVHTFMAFASMAILRCYRTETEGLTVPISRVPPTPDQNGIIPEVPRKLVLGMERYRKRLKVENRNKVIVFADASYGIFHIQETHILGGMRLKQPDPEVGTTADVFRRFGMEPPARPNHAGR